MWEAVVGGPIVPMGRRTVLEVGLALIAGAVLGTGAHLWLGPAGAASSPSVQVAGTSVERGGAVAEGVVVAASDAVVEVHAVGCGSRRQGSATFLRDRSGRAILVTNAHVARGADTVSAVLPDGAVVRLAVLSGVSGRDAVVLDAEPLAGTGLEPAPVGGAVDRGASVIVAGHPSGTFRVDATAVTDVQRRAGYGGASDVMLVGVAARGGHSGGAVMDASGAVVGLVAARDPSTGSVVAYRIADVLDAPRADLPGC